MIARRIKLNDGCEIIGEITRETSDAYYIDEVTDAGVHKCLILKKLVESISEPIHNLTLLRG